MAAALYVPASPDTQHSRSEHSDKLKAGWGRAMPGPACPSLARVYMLAASLHIDCACALTGAVHFLDALSCPRDISAWAGVFNDNLQLAGPLDARGFSEAL